MMAGELIDYLVALAVIGARGCGKTSILRGFKRQEFSSEYIPSDDDTQDTLFITNGDKRVRLEIWELPLRDASRIYSLNRVKLLVYDITAEESFKFIRDGLERITGDADRKANCVIVGNKLDKEGERKISRESGEKLAIDHGCEFMEISAKTDVNVDFLIEKIGKMFDK